MTPTGRAPAWLLLPTLGTLLAALLAGPAAAQAPYNASLLAPLPRDAADDAGRPAALTAVRAAIVHIAIEVKGRNDFRIERPASGVVVDARGLVLTLLHLVQPAQGAADKRLLVQLDNATSTALPATILATDPKLDLALLQVEPPNDAPLVAVALGDATATGAPALVVGCPEGKGLLAFAGVTSAAAAGTTCRGTALAAAEILLTDARIDQRCDGAALLGAQGQLLGLCSSEHVHREVGEPTLEDLKASNFGFAIPVARIHKAFAAQLGAVVAVALAPAASAAAVAAAAPSVVSVWAGPGPLPDGGHDDPFASRRRPGLGSGVLLSRRGLCVTNQHLVAANKKVQVKLLDGRTFPATLLRPVMRSNLALLQLELPAGATVPTIACGDGEALLGETVLGLGNPRGDAVTVTAGVLSALRDGGRLQADPSLDSRNAGGALIDVTGRLLGIVDGGRDDPIEMQFMMRGDNAKTETNLSYCAGLATVRKLFADEIESGADADESIRAPIATTDQERQRRSSQAVRTVQQCGQAMLNVYVSRSSRAADEEQNPFAELKPAEIQGESLGSGVILDGNGLALTNWHVVDAATEPDGSMKKDHVVHVRRFDGRSLPAEVLSISREDDLALLQLVLPPGERVQPVELGSSALLTVGDPVLAIGNPHGHANTITGGIVSALDQGIHVKGRWAKMENLVETDAAINGGNSGGALIDLHGRLVGINSAGSSGLAARGYAIPVDHVRKQALHLLLSAEKLRSPNLGLRLCDRDGVVEVLEVLPHGPAARAGVVAGEVLLAMDGVEAKWSGGFSLWLRQRPAGQPIELRLLGKAGERKLAVAPLSAAQWGVVRQCGVEVATIAFAEHGQLITDAAVAMHRRFTGIAVGAPGELPPQLLRVERVRQRAGETIAVAPGDLLLAVELQAARNDSETALRRLQTPEDAFAVFNDRELGSYEGAQFRCWVWRGGRIEVVELEAKRLLP